MSRIARPGAALLSAIVAVMCLPPTDAPDMEEDVTPPSARPAQAKAKAPTWSAPLPRPDVDQNDLAHMTAAEAKRARKRAAWRRA